MDDADTTIGQIVVVAGPHEQMTAGRSGNYGSLASATSAAPEPGPHPVAVHDGHRDREAVREREAQHAAVRGSGRHRLGERPVSRGRGPRRAAGSLVGRGLAAGAARGAYALLRARPPGGAATWTRTNHRGEPVTLLEGPGRRCRGRAGGRAQPRACRAGPGPRW